MLNRTIQEEDGSNVIEFDLLELLQEIKSHLIAVIAVVIIAGVAGFLVTSFLITPQYESNVTMIVNTRQDANTNVTNDNITSARNLVDTYSIIIKSNAVLDQVIDGLKLDMDYDTLNEKVSVSAVNDTQIMKVAVRDPNPRMASKIVRQIAKVAPDVIVDSAEAGSCKVISQVMTSEKPVSPNVPKNTLLAAFAGLVLAILIIVIRMVTKEKHIVDDTDVQKYLGLPVLGVIPEVEGDN